VSLEPRTQAADPAELAAMVESLSGISSELLRSYERLEERARRVEQELCIANAELERKVAEVETILETLPVGVVVRDASGRVQRVNQALGRILGWDARESLGDPAEADLPVHEDAGAPVEHRSRDGRRLVLASHRSDIVSESGEVSGSIEVFDDRTELMDLNARVHQMDKMAALGTMAAGIAHEIRNPMNAVKGFADLFLRGREAGTKDHRWATLISEGVREVDAIITSLLTFAQPEKLAVEEVLAEDLVEGAIAASLQRTPGGLPADAWTISTECDAGALRGDRIKLRQALRNLISNALDIQPQGGEVRVTARALGGAIEFTVEDAGPGIPAELVGRIADPFFTTRADGTGLGLSLVHTIARLHGGSLEVLSDPSDLGGAALRLTVPVSPLR
jgi:two-component system sensor histidine kinase HydH